MTDDALAKRLLARAGCVFAELGEVEARFAAFQARATRSDQLRQRHSERQHQGPQQERAYRLWQPQFAARHSI